MTVTVQEIVRAQRRASAVREVQKCHSTAYLLDVLRQFEREVADEADTAAREHCAGICEETNLAGRGTYLGRLLRESIKERVVRDILP